MSEVETAARMQDRKDKLRWIDAMVFHSFEIGVELSQAVMQAPQDQKLTADILELCERLQKTADNLKSLLKERDAIVSSLKDTA
jgi:hypothetical protein